MATGGDPVMIDVDVDHHPGLTGRCTEGRKLPGQWVLDGHGNPSDDPAVLH
jgi:L-lactate dehydrogenase